MNRLSILAALLLACWSLSGCRAHFYRADADGLTLYLRAQPGATVLFYSSLDGFAPHAATRHKRMWINTVPADREFRYFYTVNGQMRIPECALKEQDDFGGENCVYVPRL